MQLIEFSTQTGAGLTLAVVACMFVLFLRESYSTEVVAIGGVAVFTGQWRAAVPTGAGGTGQSGTLDNCGDVHRHGAHWCVPGLWRRLQILLRGRQKQIRGLRSVC